MCEVKEANNVSFYSFFLIQFNSEWTPLMGNQQATKGRKTPKHAKPGQTRKLHKRQKSTQTFQTKPNKKTPTEQVGEEQALKPHTTSITSNHHRNTHRYDLG